MKIKPHLDFYSYLFGFNFNKETQQINIHLFIFGLTIQLYNFKVWMNELKEIAITDMPRDYKKGDKWLEEFWQKTYFEKGFTPIQTWKDYTTRVQ